MPSSPNLNNEFNFYLENQDKLLKEYEGKFVVIKDLKVIGSYNRIEEAVEETSKTHELGTFLVQKCTPGKDDYTAVFHSRFQFENS